MEKGRRCWFQFKVSTHRIEDFNNTLDENLSSQTRFWRKLAESRPAEVFVVF